MSGKSSSWLGLYLLVGVVWGFSFYFIALGDKFLTPVGVGFWRLALGGVAMLVLSLLMRKKFPTDARTWGLLFVVSICMNSVPAALFAYAEQHVTSAFAGIMNSATPIATILVILLFFREEKPSAKVLAGLGVGLIGALLVLAIWNGFGSNDPLAIAALGGAILLYGIGGPFARRYVTSLGLDTQVQVTVQILLAALTLLPFYLAGPLVTATPDALGVGAMLVLGVLGTGFAYIWYYRLMALAGSAVANAVTFLSPVVAVLAGSLLLGETITWNEIVGGAVVILGAAISQGRLDGLFARLKR
jgi:drug/metabolite transporter (DMT)-like permease